MSDEALRRVERALATEPTSLDLRRQHARVLARAGFDDRALAALDLAWRLGAEELHDELQAQLAARRIEVGAMTLCYVPAGPFVMGSEEYDPDGAPPHLVELSAFYMAATTLTYRSLEAWEGRPAWYGPGAPWPVILEWGRVAEALGHLSAASPPPGMRGRFALPTEAQWERVFRAAYLRSDGVSPYGVRRPERGPEWLADYFDAGYYDHSPRHDPTGPEQGELRAVRGVPAIPDPQYAVFREAARFDAQFPVGRRERWVPRRGGIYCRAVFVPA